MSLRRSFRIQKMMVDYDDEPKSCIMGRRDNDEVVVTQQLVEGGYSLYLWGDEISRDYGSNYVYYPRNNNDSSCINENIPTERSNNNTFGTDEVDEEHVNDGIIDNTDEFSLSSSSSSSQRQVSKLAACLKEYTGTPCNNEKAQSCTSQSKAKITMLHLRDIHTIDHEDDIVAITQFLLCNPTCTKVWIENCDMKKPKPKMQKTKTKTTTTTRTTRKTTTTTTSSRAILPTSGEAVEEETITTTTTTTTLAPLLSAILSLRHGCCCSCSSSSSSSSKSIVEELILEGPNISNDCLNAILNSFIPRKGKEEREEQQVLYPSCCSCSCFPHDDTSATTSRGGDGCGLKRLTINKWQDRPFYCAESLALVAARIRRANNNNNVSSTGNNSFRDEEEEDNSITEHGDSSSQDDDDDSWNLSQSHLSTSFPYQLMKVLSSLSSSIVGETQQTPSSTTKTSCGELTHVTIRGLKIVRIDRGDDEEQLLLGNEVYHEEGSKQNEDSKKMMMSMRTSCNGTTKITHWDISECLFEYIFSDDGNILSRNDPAFLVRCIKSRCPLLESLRMDSLDICSMMNNHHPILMESGGSFESNTDSTISSQVASPSDLSSGEVQRYECPLLTDILAIPTFRTLEVCWESATPLAIRARLLEILNQLYGAGQIYYDGMVNCEESLLGRFFLSHEFATAMVRSWNSMESEWEQEDSETLLLRQLAKGIGASLELSYYNRKRRSSRSDDDDNNDGDCIAVDGIMKLDFSRNSWSIRDLRAIFLSSESTCALQPSLSNLQELTLTCCDINGTRFLYLICNVLCQMKMLRSLYIGYNPIFQFNDVRDETSVEFLRRTRYIYYSLLEFVRFHPRLTFLSLEGVDGISRVIREELLYILSIKRCGSRPPPPIFFKGSLGQRTTELDGNIVAPLPGANALWSLILDHSRFANFNDMSILRTDIDSILVQSQAIYYLLRGGPLMNEVVQRVR